MTCSSKSQHKHLTGCLPVLWVGVVSVAGSSGRWQGWAHWVKDALRKGMTSKLMGGMCLSCLLGSPGKASWRRWHCPRDAEAELRLELRSKWVKRWCCRVRPCEHFCLASGEPESATLYIDALSHLRSSRLGRIFGVCGQSVCGF